MKHIQTIINPETLVADLHRRAELLRRLGGSNGYLIDADYLEAAADEIERLRQALADHALVKIAVEDAPADEIVEAHGIPVVAQIEVRPDPVYGHVLKWPRETIDQYFELRRKP